MGDLGVSGISMPSVSGIGPALLNGLYFILFFGFVGGIGWFVYNNYIFRYKIEIFENLGGTRYVKTGSDRARLIKLGDGGEMIMKLKKRKCYRTAYGRKMGQNLYWFAVGQDGYWYNITLGDLDAKQGMLDIEPIDRDMRYMHVAIRKNIQDRYRKTSFMDKYGAWMLAGIFTVGMFLGGWFLIDKMGDQTQLLSTTVDTANQVMAGNKEVLSALNNLISSGGLR